MAKDQSGELTPEEETYFKTGGDTELPGEEPDEQEPEGEGEGEGESGAKAEAEAKPEEEPAAEEDPKKRSKTVPHEALHAERLKTRAEREARESAEREFREHRERTARLEERTRIMLERMQADDAPKPEEVIPDRETDPLGYLAYVENRLKSVEGKISTRESTEQEERQRMMAWQEMQSEAQREFQRDAQELPHLNDAYQHLLKSRTQELSAYGYSNDQVRQILQSEEAQIVIAARQQRRPVSSFILAHAEARGFQPQAPEPVVTDTETKRAASEAKIDSLERAKGAAQTLSNTGGPPAGDGKMTLEKLADLPDDEFDRWMAKNNKKDRGLRVLMGG